MTDKFYLCATFTNRFGNKQRPSTSKVVRVHHHHPRHSAYHRIVETCRCAHIRAIFVDSRASDPQIPVPANPPYPTPDAESNSIYQDWGAITTAASVIASWAIISSTLA